MGEGGRYVSVPLLRKVLDMYSTVHRVPNVGDSILTNILGMVGNTPMVRLDKIAKSEGLECELREFRGYVGGLL